MSRPAGLTAQERLFCSAFAREANATKAARAAGYAEKGIAVAGNRLMKRPLIRAEIDRLRREMDEAGKGLANALLTEATKTGAIPPGVSNLVPHITMAMERAFHQHMILTAAGMALGEIPRRTTTVIKPRPTVKNPHPVPIMVDGYVHRADPREAATVAVVLGKELDRIDEERAKNAPLTIEGDLAEESGLTKALRAYQEKWGAPVVPITDKTPKET